MDRRSNDSRSTSNSAMPGLKTFLVCGMTGVGKSSFINKVTGSRLSVSGRLDSDTVDVIEEGIPLIRVGNEYIQLVDTPGFGDSREESETVILRRITTWLVARHISNLPVTGVLFLRPIHEVRANRLEKALMAMFKDLCGDDCLDHIILVTTRWTSESTEEDQVRESELATRTDYFGSDGEKRVQVERLNDRCSAEEARSLVKSFAGLSPVTFQIQREVVDEELTLGQTQAGMRIGADLEERLSGLEERARRATEYAEAARERLEEAEGERTRLQSELVEAARRAAQAEEMAREAQREAEAARNQSEEERRKAEERERKAKAEIEAIQQETREMQARLEQEKKDMAKLKTAANLAAQREEKLQKEINEYKGQINGMGERVDPGPWLSFLNSVVRMLTGGHVGIY